MKFYNYFFDYTLMKAELTQASDEPYLILYHAPDWPVIVTFAPFERPPTIGWLVPGPLRTLRPVAEETVPVFGVESFEAAAEGALSERKVLLT